MSDKETVFVGYHSYPEASLPQNRIGMTVREEIASRVLAGMLANGKDRERTYEGLLGAVVGYTDALIEELERTKK